MHSLLSNPTLNTADTSKLRSGLMRWAVVLVLSGIMFRVVGALWFSGNYSMDHAVPCLMTKHIAEGRSWPVFYYGQPYMGSLESIVGAKLFYRLPVDKNFACNLGTAVFGMLILPVLFYWGRGTRTPTSGLAAMALLVIGPPVYMQFMNWSYGGYAAVTFFQAAVMAVAISIVLKERQNPGTSTFWQWCLLGLVAGLGWWTSPMIIPGILAAGLFLLIMVGRNCFRRHVLAAGAVFFAGSFPLWWWNYQNSWETIVFLGRRSGGGFLEGLSRFFPGLLSALLGDHAFWTLPLGLLVAVCVLYSAFIIFRDRKNHDLAVHHLAAWVFFLVAVWFFASRPERIGPSRYFLPLAPAMAVLIAHAIHVLNVKVHRTAGWVLLTLLMVDQARILPVYAGWYQSRHTMFAEFEEMRHCFERLDTDVIYGTYTHRTRGYGLNFYYDEQFRFVDFPFHERQPEYSRAVELVESPVIFNHLGHILEFLKATGGSAEYMTCATDCHLTHRLKPASDKMIPLVEGFSIHDPSSGENISEIVGDNNLGTYWVNNRYRNNRAVEISFEQPGVIHGIRFTTEDQSRPSRVRILVKASGDTRWRALADYPFTVWFWSGPRPYPRGTHYRQEFRIDTGPIVAMRLEFGEEESDRQMRIHEIQLFEKQKSPDEVNHGNIAQLADFLSAYDIESVYSDRWEANRLYVEGLAQLKLVLDELAFRREPRRISSRLLFNGNVALVLRQEESMASQELLSRMNIPFEAHTVDVWVVFVVKEPVALMSSRSPLRWLGYSVMIDPDFAWVESVAENAEQAIRDGHADEAELLLKYAGMVWPSSLAVMRAERDLAVLRRNQEQVSLLDTKIRKATSPEIVLNALFESGIRLIGLDVTDTTVRRGGSFDYETLWHIPDHVDAGRLAIFVHVRDGEGVVRFQGDRAFIDDRRYEYVDRHHVREHRSFPVPADAEAGRYSMQMGLYEANPPHAKLRIRRADVPFKRGHVELPAALMVE